MKIVTYNWLPFKGGDIDAFPNANLVLVIGSRTILENEPVAQIIAPYFKNASIVTCSTAGEINDDGVHEGTVSITAIQFEKTPLKATVTNLYDCGSSYQTGLSIYNELKSDNLKHILVFSDGQVINGSELVRGLNENSDNGVAITGALAGDDQRFTKTIVGLNGNYKDGNVVAIGFYGDAINIGYGSMGGWEPFGISRRITRSEANKLYELDGQNALEIYKAYLGEESKHLPGSALKFPLALENLHNDSVVTRTILSVDEKEGSMTFAGDVPQGSKVRFMKGSFQKLVKAAGGATNQCMEHHADKIPQLAFIASCIGRKIILGKRTREEVDIVTEFLGFGTKTIGFYSYGEICPLKGYAGTHLQNQTMTITTIAE